MGGISAQIWPFPIRGPEVTLVSVGRERLRMVLERDAAWMCPG